LLCWDDPSLLQITCTNSKIGLEIGHILLDTFSYNKSKLSKEEDTTCRPSLQEWVTRKNPKKDSLDLTVQ